MEIRKEWSDTCDGGMLLSIHNAPHGCTPTCEYIYRAGQKNRTLPNISMEIVTTWCAAVKRICVFCYNMYIIFKV